MNFVRLWSIVNGGWTEKKTKKEKCTRNISFVPYMHFLHKSHQKVGGKVGNRTEKNA